MRRNTGVKQSWSMTEEAFNCLIDRNRTEAFRKAIMSAVSKGDVVVDAGTGTGILAMFAAAAGAGKVYAVEVVRRNTEPLAAIFRMNGFGDTIHIIKGDARTVTLPQRANVIICEMISTGLIEELQVPVMNRLLTQAAPDVKVVLQSIECHLELVQAVDTFYGYKMPLIQYEYPREESVHAKPLSAAVAYARADFTRPIGTCTAQYSGRVPIVEQGTVNGIRISNLTRFHDGSILRGTAAYCYPLVLPVAPIEAVRGALLEVNLGYEMCQGVEPLHWSVSRSET